jgi:hypothetical protein
MTITTTSEPSRAIPGLNMVDNEQRPRGGYTPTLDDGDDGERRERTRRN